VNQFNWHYLIYPCLDPLPPLDRLEVQNIAAGDNAVVMMDSRAAAGPRGCRNDEILRTTGERTLGNVLAAEGCGSEISVFAARNAMSFNTPVTAWTNAIGDTYTVTMQPIINVPVSVWIANGAAGVQARLDFANADLLYEQNKVGVQFVPTYHDVSTSREAVETIGTARCIGVRAIRASSWYTANTLNFYYVNGAFTGNNCGGEEPDSDPNITYVGTTANVATVAHEIGHAFGLTPAWAGGHVNEEVGFGNNNIMWGGGPPTRHHFSLGQAFRMNTYVGRSNRTMLIGNGLRPGPGRDCPPVTASSTCPLLVVDWPRF
jgi:hypothetical protein